MNVQTLLLIIGCLVIGLMVGLIAGYIITWKASMEIIDEYKKIIEDDKKHFAELRNRLAGKL